jgi:GDP/UDP-N,N'-diacetylbacillosamine 2-epimerase (hydrolysing)
METKSSTLGLNSKFRIGVLTSSRADFGIYYPLLIKLENHSLFDIEIIAFGTHLDENYGHTIDEINSYGFDVKHQIKTLTYNNNPYETSVSIGNTMLKFSEFWKNNEFNLVFCLGDRYEMFAAVSASLTFGVNLAHLHAGETTLGAVDNVFRHSISLMCKYLFVSTEKYRKRAIQINNNPGSVYNVGALSIDNLENLSYYSKKEFNDKFKIDLTIPTILSTFHPETISLSKNSQYIDELIMSFNELKERYQIVITMPNSDTLGDMIREKIIDFSEGLEQVKLVESFGMKGYLSCMKHCSFLLGNTSSGFVEASYFPKKVINLGQRQSGRIITENILNTPIEKKLIIDAVKKLEKNIEGANENIYKKGNTADNIIDVILKLIK